MTLSQNNPVLNFVVLAGTITTGFVVVGPYPDMRTAASAASTIEAGAQVQTFTLPVVQHAAVAIQMVRQRREPADA